MTLMREDSGVRDLHTVQGSYLRWEYQRPQSSVQRSLHLHAIAR